MQEIERRKDVEDEAGSLNDAMDTDDSSNAKILFKRQSSSKEHRKPSFNKSVSLRKEIEYKDDSEESSDKPTLKGSKVVMPEYVIGQKVATKTKKRSNTDTETGAKDKKSERQNKPQLQHLFDEEDEDEEDED